MPILPRPSYAQGFARCAAESIYPDLWPGLVGAFAPTLGVTGNAIKNVVRGGVQLAHTGANPITWTPDHGGLAAVAGANSGYSTTDTRLVSIPLDNFSVMLVGSGAGAAANTCAISWAGTDDLLFYCFENTKGTRIFWRHGPNAQPPAATNNAAVNDSKVHGIILVSRSDTAHELWEDGSLNATPDGDASGRGPFTTFALNVWTDNTDQQFAGTGTPRSYAYYVWDRAITPHQIATLTMDPLAPLRLRRRTIVRAPVVTGTIARHLISAYRRTR